MLQYYNVRTSQPRGSSQTSLTCAKDFWANSRKRDGESAHAHPERVARSHWSAATAQYILRYTYIIIITFMWVALSYLYLYSLILLYIQLKRNRYRGDVMLHA